MTGFFLQNTVAVIVGLSAGFVCHSVSPVTELPVLLAAAICGFLGVHLPNIQQPTLLSYRLIRGASWLISLLVPLVMFFYRPAEFIFAWIITILFTSCFWFIIDRVSLQRDFTRSLVGITILPLILTGCAYLALGQVALLPAFLASNAGYITFLLVENYVQNGQIPLLSTAKHILGSLRQLAEKP